MTPQERDLITTLLDRLKNSAGQPKDPEADALIRRAMIEQPDAPYSLVQTVLIQDLSLHNAQSRIAELEQQVATAQAPKPTSFLGGLFGTNQPAGPPVAPGAGGPWARSPAVAPPPPQGGGYAPQPGYPPQGGGYAPPAPQAPAGGGMMGGGGGSFLRSAAATAAGVAGGALLFQGISSMFGHSYASSLGGGGMGGTPGLGETVTNNYYEGGSSGGGDFGGGGDYAGGGGGDYAGGDYGGGGQDYSDGGGDFGGGDSTSC